MTDTRTPSSAVSDPPVHALAIKGTISGVLMGLANLVPGVSAGAVLLATGIFRAFLNGLAELTTLTFRRNSIILLGFLGFGWVLAVLLGAGVVKQLVVDHRWIMYSIFIGLTLGGVPLVYGPADKRSASMWISAAIGLAIMTVLGLVQMFAGLGASDHAATWWKLAIGGVLAAGATVLPGGSGTFVLLLMGLYVPILGGVSGFKDALIARDFASAFGVALTLAPFAVGMLVGLASVSVGRKWTLARFPQSTMGMLLGLLVGSVVALWPFQQGVQPKVGDVVKGRVLTEETLASIKPDDWPVAFFSPTAVQILIAAALIVVALILTLLLARAEEKLGASSSN